MSCPSENSSTRNAQSRSEQTVGGKMNFEIRGRAHQINPTQANRTGGENVNINNNYEAPGDNHEAPGGNPSPARDIPIENSQTGSRSSGNSSTRNAQKESETAGGTMNFDIDGWEHQINPSQGNRITGRTVTITNSYKAPGGNATRDTTGTG